eukprot:scaffold298589_cov19-Tisochrysis_lutea.AAC.3
MLEKAGECATLCKLLNGVCIKVLPASRYYLHQGAACIKVPGYSLSTSLTSWLLPPQIFCTVANISMRPALPPSRPLLGWEQKEQDCLTTCKVQAARTSSEVIVMMSVMD